MTKKIKKEQLLIGVLAGILLLMIAIPLPGKEQAAAKTENAQGEERMMQTTTEEQLKNILQQISGVGKTEVFISYADDGKIVVEKDCSISEELVQEADSSGGTRTTTTTRSEQETVCRNSEMPYVIQELTPTVKGVLVVAQGADNEKIKTQIRETIVALFGLETHKISIMKMEVSR